LQLLCEACRLRGLKRSLLDVRDVTSNLTSEDLMALVQTYCDAGFAHNHRLAILHSGDPHRRARRFAFISTLRGLSVRAFSDFEKALAWLALTDSGKLDRKTPADDHHTAVVRSTPRNRRSTITIY
jgi:hypothetical protein